MRDELLADIAPRYRPEDYSLLWHNCNHFSHEYAQLLTGEGLPVGARLAPACTAIAAGAMPLLMLATWVCHIYLYSCNIIAVDRVGRPLCV